MLAVSHASGKMVTVYKMDGYTIVAMADHDTALSYAGQGVAFMGRDKYLFVGMNSNRTRLFDIVSEYAFSYFAAPDIYAPTRQIGGFGFTQHAAATGANVTVDLLFSE